MGSERFRRFLRIERRRPAGDQAPAPEGPARFGALERAHPAAPPPEGPGSPGLERFRRRESGLELDRDGDAQPFRRCCRCGADANRQAAACGSCGADLRTPEQDAFNARLREAMRREAEAEARREAARREAARVASEEDLARRQALAEQLAAEIGRQERARLDREGFGGGGRDEPPLALRLLRRIEDRQLRVGVGLGVGAAFALLFVYALSAGRAGLVLGLFAIALVLVAPPRFLRRRW